MPPNAAIAGIAASRGLVSSPTASSRLISRPTTKKKIAMSASLTQACRLRSRCSGEFGPNVFDQRSSYEPGARFAHTSAARVAMARTMPPVVSSRMNSASGRRGTRSRLVVDTSAPFESADQTSRLAIVDCNEHRLRGCAYSAAKVSLRKDPCRKAHNLGVPQRTPDGDDTDELAEQLIGVADVLRGTPARYRLHRDRPLYQCHRRTRC